MSRIHTAPTKSNVSIKGNTITFENISASEIASFLYIKRLTQMTLLKTGEREDGDSIFSLSYPMRTEEHKQYAGLIHRQNAEAKKLAKKGGKPDNDPTPPKGTPPMGGGGSTTEFVETLAIAA